LTLEKIAGCFTFFNWGKTHLFQVPKNRGVATAPALVFHDGSDQIPWAPCPGNGKTHQNMIKIGGFVVLV